MPIHDRKKCGTCGFSPATLVKEGAAKWVRGTMDPGFRQDAPLFYEQPLQKPVYTRSHFKDAKTSILKWNKYITLFKG
jgi:hypothetical protein